MIKFQEEVSSCTCQKNIVLGNGFGISYDFAFEDDSFSWATLLDLCEIEEGSQLHGLLNECNYDFELVHKKLNNTIDIVSRYSPRNTLINELTEQVQYLRDQLIIAVARSHPGSFNLDFTTDTGKVRKQKIQSCRAYLKEFSYVFSLNYDLLLYWVRCFENKHIGQDSFGLDDGELIFTPNEGANYLFPHGALFLFRNGIGARKSRSTKEEPILARVEESIRNGVFPMCISEGTGKQKMSAIETNTYLSFSYNKIKQCEGTIFTFGCSFIDDKDSHIIKAMIESPSKKIVVGQFHPTKESRLRLEHEFEVTKNELKKDKEVVIADTSSVQIW